MNDAWPTQRAEPERVGDPGAASRPVSSRAERRRERERQARIRRRRRTAFAGIVVVFLVVVGGIAYPLRHTLGLGSLFGDSVADWSSDAGAPQVIVHITGTNNSDFAQSLVDAGVVRSTAAFNHAAGNQPISSGYYELDKHMSTPDAVKALSDPQRAHRVGMLSVPSGAQLDDKHGVDKKVTEGIFSMISDATAYTLNGTQHRVTVAQLVQAAATASVADLQVPDWAAAAVQAKTGDHRRIEGLIAPGVWDEVNPDDPPTAILAGLIAQSAAKFESQGLLDASPTSPADLTPYEVLISASVVEREVNQAQYYPKVARVILNRLAKKQRLQMDSTVNYTAAVTDIDVAGQNLSKPTDWNTYVKYGLPATPIGAIGQDALSASENPEPGPWLYFVTVDQSGTTLFTDDFAEHERNRERACETKLLSTGCK